MVELLDENIERFSEIGLINLYHGSLKGLNGPIRVDYQKMQKFYDFGPGFYCATRPSPAVNILYPYDVESYRNRDNLPQDYNDPFLYKLEVDLSNYAGVSISGMAWALFVAYNRNAFSQDLCPEFYDSVASFMEGIDLVSGPISNDKTFLVLGRFLDDEVTFTCMDHALRCAKTGTQYVIRSQSLADELNIVDTKRLSLSICRKLAEKSRANAPKRKNAENKIIKQFRREGLYLSELIEEINKNRVVFPDSDGQSSILNLRP